MSGLIELLALSDRDFLARTAYVEDAANPGNKVNRLRISGHPRRHADSAGRRLDRRRTDILPVTKTLLLDLGSSPNLPSALVGLDNFEGMAIDPTPPRGRSVRPFS